MIAAAQILVAPLVENATNALRINDAVPQVSLSAASGKRADHQRRLNGGVEGI